MWLSETLAKHTEIPTAQPGRVTLSEGAAFETDAALRSRSVREVKQTNGMISFKDDLIFQKSL